MAIEFKKYRIKISIISVISLQIKIHKATLELKMYRNNMCKYLKFFNFKVDLR